MSSRTTQPAVHTVCPAHAQEGNQMNTSSTRTMPARDAKGRFVKAILAVTDWSNPAIYTEMIARGPDFYDEGMAHWIGPRAAVSIPIEREVRDIRDILAMPRFTDIPGGWARLSTEHYGVHVSLFAEDDVPTAQDSWTLFAEAVSL